MKLLIANLLFFYPIYSVRLTQKTLCRDCKHFIGNSKKCAIFGEPDLVNGKPDHEYASISRRKECGEDAIYFEENKMKFITGLFFFRILAPDNIDFSLLRYLVSFL